MKALDEGWIAGAAIDVFEKEPITEHPLFAIDEVVVTPHLGASTAEAQERVAIDVAEQILAVLDGEPARYAVNAPLIDPETYSCLAPYLPVAQKVGALAIAAARGPDGRASRSTTPARSPTHDVTPLKAAVIGGLLHDRERGPRQRRQRRPHRRSGAACRSRDAQPDATSIYSNLITVRLKGSGGETEVSGTAAHDGPHIVVDRRLLGGRAAERGLPAAVREQGPARAWSAPSAR